MTNNNINNLKILLVEDNDLNQKFATVVLKKLGHQVDLAENGKRGVELFLENEYDLILMDIQMPLMNGIEATSKIREYEKQLQPDKAVVIFAVTAYAMDYDRQNCFEAGVDDFLAKPFKAQSLADMIYKYFKDRIS